RGGSWLMMAALFIIYIVIRCKINPSLGPAISQDELKKYSLKDKLKLLQAGIIPLFIFFSMTGLFLMGITSLVESSAVGAVAATLAALFKGRLTKKVIEETTRKSLGVSCMFMWIILAALTFGAVFDGVGAVKAIEGFFIGELGLGPWEILILMQLSFIIMGTFLDDTAMLIIIAPLYIPLVKMLGFDLIWYGVLYTITCQIAYMTPPFGYNLFLMRAMAPPEVSIIDIYRSVIPFVAIMVLSLAIIMLFPQIALWLPNMFYAY
ncbi:MAG: TRAP transporter large permease subunit, partial [Alphaproteobacteria bacterium]|nr:TRAP transporter large permease subunit [Alphaproteobacteria bacterium]